MISAVSALVAATAFSPVNADPVLVLTGAPVAGEEKEGLAKAHREGVESLGALAEKKGWVLVDVGTSVLVADEAALGLARLDLRIDILKCLVAGKNPVSANESGKLGSTVQDFMTFTFAGKGLDVRGKDFAIVLNPCTALTTKGKGGVRTVTQSYGNAD